MRRICFLSHTSELNGAELCLLQILEEIDRDKFRPALVVPGKGLFLEEAIKLSVDVEVIPAKWWLTEKRKVWKQPFARLLNIRAVLRLARWIKKNQVDLVFSNSSASWSGALAAKKTHVPHVWYIHELLGAEIPQLNYIFGKKALVRKIVRLSCRVLVNSLATGAFFKDKTNVHLVYNGVQLQQDVSDKIRVKGRQWGLESQDIVFGMVGKICAEKGQREVIMALGMLGKHLPVKLLIIGGVKSEVYYAEILDICQSYDLKEKVVFAGYQRDVFYGLRLMDCLIVASATESFGRTIIEAMSVKTPVIAVKSGGIPEIISSGTNGFLLDSRKPEVIKEGMVSFLKNRDVHRRAAEEGFRTVQRKFLLSGQVKKIEQVLEECLDEHGARN